MVDIEHTKEQRRLLKKLLDIAEKLDGRYVSRLSDDDKKALVSAVDAALDAGISGVVGAVQTHSSTKKPKIVAAGVRDLLKHTEELIHTADTVDTLPSKQEYLAALEQLKMAAGRLRDEATAAGISYGYLNQFTPVARF